MVHSNLNPIYCILPLVSSRDPLRATYWLLVTCVPGKTTHEWDNFTCHWSRWESHSTISTHRMV